MGGRAHHAGCVWKTFIHRPAAESLRCLPGDVRRRRGSAFAMSETLPLTAAKHAGGRLNALYRVLSCGSILGLLRGDAIGLQLLPQGFRPRHPFR